MISPQIILQNMISSMLNFLHEDSKEVNKNDSFLYHLLNTDDNNDVIKLDNKVYYDEALAMFSRKVDDSRKIQSFIGFNRKRVSEPTIHIIMPSDATTTIGIGDNVDFAETYGTSEENQIFDSATNSFSSTYNLIITSNVMNEVLIMYDVLKACFIAFRVELEDKGLQNLKISGADIMFQQELMPADILHRTLTLNFTYDFSIPSREKRKLYNKFTLTPNLRKI